MLTWLLVLAAWVLLGVPAALVLGRGIRLADERAPRTPQRLTTADLPEDLRAPFLPTR